MLNESVNTRWAWSALWRERCDAVVDDDDRLSPYLLKHLHLSRTYQKRLHRITPFLLSATVTRRWDQQKLWVRNTRNAAQDNLSSIFSGTRDCRESARNRQHHIRSSSAPKTAWAPILTHAPLFKYGQAEKADGTKHLNYSPELNMVRSTKANGTEQHQWS